MYATRDMPDAGKKVSIYALYYTRISCSGDKKQGGIMLSSNAGINGIQHGDFISVSA